METICRIIKQHPLEKREYPDRDGVVQTVKSVKVDLQSGAATYQAEATGQLAERLAEHPLNASLYHLACLKMRLDHVKTREGREFDVTRIMLTTIDPL